MRAPTKRRRFRGRWWVWTQEDTLQNLEMWPLLRQLFSEPWFGVAFAINLLTGLFIVVASQPLWRINDPMVPTPMRITLVDAFDALVAGREAARLEAKGNLATAAEYWRVALAYHPLHPDLLRRALANGLKEPNLAMAHRAEMMHNALLYLMVERTNSASIDLLARISSLYATDEMTLELTNPLTNRATPVLLAERAKALFALGRFAEFDRAAAAVSADPELALYRVAREASREGTDASAGLQQLRAASTIPAQRTVAVRLLLAVHYLTGSVNQFGETLAQASELHIDRLSDHVRYWLVLERAGRTADAAALAGRYTRPPQTPDEFQTLLSLCIHYHLDAEADNLVERFAFTMPVGAPVWVGYAEYLVEHERWRDLRRLAVRMRGRPTVFAALGGFTCAIDALGARKMGNKPYMDALASLATRLPIRDENVALVSARHLLDADAPGAALELLSRLKSLEAEPSYWSLVVRAAQAKDDAATLLMAARRRHQLEPRSAAAAMDLCAALLMSAQGEAEALTLARSVLSSAPSHPGARLNYALALAVNQQPEAALEVLSTIERPGLGAAEAANLAWIRTLALSSEGKLEQAAVELAKVDPRRLLQPQRDQLDRVRRRIARSVGQR